MEQNKNTSSILNNFNALAKSKRLLRVGVFAVLTGVPAISNAIEIENIDINNPDEVMAFAKQEALSFLQSYKAKAPQNLQPYITNKPARQTVINLTVKEEAVKYDITSKSVIDLNKDSKRYNGNNSIGDNTITLGHTLQTGSIKIISKIAGSVSIKDTALWIERLDITQVLKQTVTIASELQDYSCNGEQVKQHEQQHVGFNNASFRAYSSIVEDFYKNALAPINGIRVPKDKRNYGDVLKEMTSYVSVIMKDINNAKLETTRKMHGKIDSKASYGKIEKRINEICGKNPQLDSKLRKAIKR